VQTRNAGTSLISNAPANDSVVSTARSDKGSGRIGRNVGRSSEGKGWQEGENEVAEVSEMQARVVL
jgi:hypothetical protein